MSCARNTRALALVVLSVLCAGGRSFAAAKSDTTQAFLLVITDTPERFRAVGTLSSIDRSVPPDGFKDVRLSPSGFPTYVIPKSSNWLFRIGTAVQNWHTDPLHPAVETGANNVINSVDGFHLHGPHQTGPILDKDPDTLKVITAVGVPLIDVEFGAKKKSILTAVGMATHLTLSPGIRHYDHYGMKQTVTAIQGPPHSVVGPTEVAAKHTTSSQPSTLFGPTLGSSPAAGSHASYDAPTGTLTIHPGTLDIFRVGGSIAPGTDAPFVGDPITNATLGDVVLHFVGPTGDGGYRFTGGTTSLTDPEAQLRLAGSFSEYRIYNTSRLGTIDSYALYDSLRTADLGGDCTSAFMGRFVNNNVTGDSISDAVWLAIQGTCLTFRTVQNLALLTANFTASATHIPATVVISANKMIP